MPWLARFRTAAIGDLAEQLRYAPAGTRLRQMDAAEKLLDELDPAASYPDEFIMFRITGYRPERAAMPIMCAGADLVPDLVNLIQWLSLDLGLTEGGDRRAAPLAEVARRLNVSLRTVHRLREAGLVRHYVVFADGHRQLACFDDAVERFTARHDDRLTQAAAYARLGAEARRQIVQRAAELARTGSVTMNQAANALAREHGRGVQTMREILQQHVRDAAGPWFNEHGPLTARDQRLIYRAMARGVRATQLGRRFGKSAAAIHRADLRHRAKLLASLDLRHVELATFRRAEARDVILAAPAVLSPPSAGPIVEHDAVAWLQAMDSPAWSDQETTESALGMLAAFNYLKRRARLHVEALSDWPTAAAIDRIETDLRWAIRLKCRLVRAMLPVAVGRIEAWLGRSLLQESAEGIASLLQLAVDVASDHVETIDPGRRQRLDRLTALGMDRALARQPARPQHRAAARHRAHTVRMPSLLAGLCAWQTWLDVPSALVQHIDLLPAGDRTLLVARYGLAAGDARPRTVSELAVQERSTRSAVSRRLAAALSRLRAAARGSS